MRKYWLAWILFATSVLSIIAAALVLIIFSTYAIGSPDPDYYEMTGFLLAVLLIGLSGIFVVAAIAAYAFAPDR